ncbi:hypothetical protein COE43_12700 [Bacillus cereus]|nr:hypothetical protein COE43_12700 [Bacillus cereus]
MSYPSSLHFSVKVISRMPKGRINPRSTVACASYRSDEKLFDERNNKTFDFRNHSVKPETFILSPSHAPSWVNDRAKLWNSVEKVEKAYNAQLARDVVLAIPNDLTKEQQKKLVENFVKEQFVSKGMIADVCIHRDEEHNPHAHVMLTMRPINEDGKWGTKRPCIGTDENGKKVYGNNPWDDRKNVDMWRKAYQDACNETFKKLNLNRSFDLRSYEKQGREEIGTKHLGHVAHGIEEREKKNAKELGIEYKPVTEQGKINRDIQNVNNQVRAYQNEIRSLEKDLIDLRQKRDEKAQDPRYVLQKMGLWNKLSAVEKTSIMFVRKRMKEEKVSLTDALQCNEQINRWEVSLNKKKDTFKSEVENIEKAKNIMMDYQKSVGDLSKRAALQKELGKLGFSVTNIKNELEEKVKELQKAKPSLMEQEVKLKDAKQTVNTAIRTLEKLTVEEAKIIYKGDSHINKFHPAELEKLVKEYKQHGSIIPLNQAHVFLENRQIQLVKNSVSPLETYRSLTKDNTYLINWKRKLDRVEKDTESIRASNPVGYAQQMKVIAQQRETLAERMKKLKTTMSIVEKAIVTQVKRDYPNEKWIDNIDVKTAKRILELNEKERRVVPIEEIQKYAKGIKHNDRNANSPERNESEPYIQKYTARATSTSAELATEISQAIQSFIRQPKPDMERKSDLDNMLDEQKRRSEIAKRKHRGR